MLNNLVLYGTVSILLCSLILHRYLRVKAGPKLPPGPRPLPLIGNIFDFPPQGIPEFQHWINHKDTYGPISSVTIMGLTLIIIHDKEAAYEILERKSVKTSARPRMEFAHNMCGFDEFLMSQQYDDNFRDRRKIIHNQLGSQTRVSQYNDLQDVEVRRFLLRLLEEPGNLFQHLKTSVSL